jgi:hypothetical protein
LVNNCDKTKQYDGGYDNNGAIEAPITELNTELNGLQLH